MPVNRATTLTAFRNAPALPDLSRAAAAPSVERLRETPAKLNFHIYGDLTAIESDWRRFERNADCTAFQTFDWLSAWHRNIGLRQGVHLAIIVGRYSDDEIAFIMPFCVEPERLARRLCWLGQKLSDYNGPLLAPDFSQRVPRESFLALWRELKAQMQCDPLLRYDWIEFEKMPETIGAQINPFTFLRVALNASGAHLTHLADDWEKFYTAKRSSATRRRDRAKRRHMSEFGEVHFVTAAGRTIPGARSKRCSNKKAGRSRAGELPTSLPRPDTASFFSTSHQIRKAGICFTSAELMLANRARLRTSASCSAIATTTWSPVTTTAISRTTDLARFICANSWLKRSE